MNTEHFTEALYLTHNFNPEVSPASRLAAEEYLMQLQNSSDGLNLSFHIISNEPVNEIRCFWAFNTILTHMSDIAKTVDNNQAEELFKTLFSFIYRCFFSPTTTTTTTISSNNINMNAMSSTNNTNITLPAEYLLNKHAQVMAAGLHNFYPSRWSAFFDELFELLNRRVSFPHSSYAVTMYFIRVFEYIDEKVVIRVRELSERSCNNTTFTNTNTINNEINKVNNTSSTEVLPIAHSKDKDMAVKDNMRVYVIPKVVNTWFNILCEFQNTTFANNNLYSNNNNNNCSEIAKCTLNVLQTYIEWIDIRLCTTPEWIHLLFFLLSFNSLRNAVLDVFISLVVKKQMPGMKMSLLSTLNVCEMMPRLVNMVHEQQNNKKEDIFININNSSSNISMLSMKSESSNSNNNNLFQPNSSFVGLASLSKGSTSFHNNNNNAYTSEKDDEVDKSISTLTFAESVARLNVAISEQFVNLLNTLRSHLLTNTNVNCNNNVNSNVIEDGERGFVLMDIPFEINDSLLNNLSAALHSSVQSLLHLFQLNASAEMNEFILPFWQSYVKNSELQEDEAVELLSVIFNHTLLSSFKSSGDNETNSINISNNNNNNNNNEIEMRNANASCNNNDNNNNNSSSSKVMFDEELIIQRKSLYHLIRLLHRKFPGHVIQYAQKLVQDCLYHSEENLLLNNNNYNTSEWKQKENSSITNSLPSSSCTPVPIQVEALLRLVYELGEAVKLECLKDENHTLTQLFTHILLHGEGILCNQTSNNNNKNSKEEMGLGWWAPYVHLAYFELMDRYYIFFTFHVEHIPRLLHHLLLLQAGILNPHGKVRSRICYFCSHIMQLLKPWLAPYALDVVHALLSILNGNNKNDDNIIMSDDTSASIQKESIFGVLEKQQLYEAIGGLLRLHVNTFVNSTNNTNTNTNVSNENSVLSQSNESINVNMIMQEVSEPVNKLLMELQQCVTTSNSNTSNNLQQSNREKSILEIISSLSALMKGIGSAILPSQLKADATHSGNKIKNVNNSSNNSGNNSKLYLSTSTKSNYQNNINNKMAYNEAENVNGMSDIAHSPSFTNNNNNTTLNEEINSKLIDLFVLIMNHILGVLESCHGSSAIRECCGQFFHRLLNVAPFECVASSFTRYVMGSLQTMETITELAKLLRLMFQCIGKINTTTTSTTTTIITCNNINHHEGNCTRCGEIGKIVNLLTPLLWAKVQDVGVLANTSLLSSVIDVTNEIQNSSSSNNNNNNNNNNINCSNCSNGNNEVIQEKSSPLVCMGVISDQARDKIDVYKQFFLYLFAIAAKPNGCQCLLALPHDLLNSMLLQLLGALSLPTETEVGKVSLQIFNKLFNESCLLLTRSTTIFTTSSCCMNDNSSTNAKELLEDEIRHNAEEYIHFLHQSVLPFTLRLFTSQRISFTQYRAFDLNDAKNFLLIGEFVQLCKSLVNYNEEATLQVMYQSLSGTIGDESAMKMCVLLRDATQMNAALKLHIRQVLLNAQRAGQRVV